MAKNFPSSKSGQSPKVNSHAQAMAWSKSHVSANGTKATGSQTGSKMTSFKANKSTSLPVKKGKW